MTPKDITVGRTYKNKLIPTAIFLGIGFRTMFTGSLDNTGEMDSKHLVIISESKWPEYIGLVFKEGESCIPGYWDNFELI